MRGLAVPGNLQVQNRDLVMATDGVGKINPWWNDFWRVLISRGSIEIPRLPPEDYACLP